MNYHINIHNLTHVLKTVLGHLLFFDFFAQKNQLIVLNYHGTQKKFIPNFIKQISYLKKRYDIISPSQFSELILSNQKISGKKILITFDDGIKNNIHAINELDKLNISSLLFIVPQFIETDTLFQKDFFVKNIRQIINPSIDSNIEDFTALSWSELKKISEKHAIGCHSYSHTMQKNTLNSELLKKEIIDSKFIIENNIGVTVDSFCSINNTFLSIGKNELQLIKENYKYHFTTFGGNNIAKEPLLIRRINVESFWLKGALKFALSSIEQYRWNNKTKKYLKTMQ